MSSRRLLLASLLLALAMGCVGLTLRSVAPAFAATDGPGASADVPTSSYVPLAGALVLLVAGVLVLVSAVRRRQ